MGAKRKIEEITAKIDSLQKASLIMIEALQRIRLMAVNSEIQSIINRAFRQLEGVIADAGNNISDKVPSQVKKTLS